METTSGLEYSKICQLFLPTPQHLNKNWHKKILQVKKTQQNLNYHFCFWTSEWISGRAYNAKQGSNHRKPVLMCATQWMNLKYAELSDRSQTQGTDRGLPFTRHSATGYTQRQKTERGYRVRAGDGGRLRTRERLPWRHCPKPCLWWATWPHWAQKSMFTAPQIISQQKPFLTQSALLPAPTWPAFKL